MLLNFICYISSLSIVLHKLFWIFTWCNLPKGLLRITVYYPFLSISHIFFFLHVKFMLLVVMLFWYYDIVSMLQKLVNIWHESYGFSLVAVSICMCLNLLFTFFGLSQLFAKSQSLYCCMTDFCFLYCPLVLNCICATLVFWIAFVPQCHMPHWHDIFWLICKESCRSRDQKRMKSLYPWNPV